MANVQKKADSPAPLTTEEKEAIRLQFQNYKQLVGKGFEKLQISIGINVRYLLQIDNGKYDHKPEVKDYIFKTLKCLIDSRTATATLFPTKTMQACFSILSRAQDNHYMVGIEGETGLGKTKALQAYAGRSNVFYISYGYSMRPQQFLAALLAELGISYTGSPYDMIQRIAKYLNSLSDPLLIIDEAGKMRDTVMMHIQELRDLTMYTTGIALAGMPYFKETLEKYADRGKRGYSEFNRRIILWQSLSVLDKKEIVQICQNSGITDPETITAMTAYRSIAELSKEIIEYHIQNPATDETANN